MSVVFCLYYKLTKHTKAECLKNVNIITFANHKGGVGKTTQVFFLSKYIATSYPDKDIILVDGSIYNDLTRLCLDDTHYKIPTISSLINISKKRLKEQPKSVSEISLKLKSILPHTCVPQNLHIITNGNQDKYPLNDIQNIRRCLNNIAKRKRDIIMICDTDGGMMHDLTCLSIGIADSIVVPLPIDTQSILRMTTLLEYIYFLHKKGHKDTTIRMFIYNNLPVSNNTPSKECQSYNLPFKVNSSIITDIQTMKSIMSNLNNKFPNIIDEKCCFYGIRNGGMTLQQAKTRGTPFHSVLSQGVSDDFEKCSQMMMNACQKKVIKW